MKYFCFTFLLLANISLAQHDIPINTSIKEVTVFLKGAQVTRTGIVTMVQGKATYTVLGLSPYLDTKSINVSAEGDFTVLSVNPRVDYLGKRNQSHKVDSIRVLLKELENEITIRENRSMVLSEKQNFLDKNKDLSSNNSSISLDQLDQTLNFFDNRLTEILEEKSKLNLQIDSISNVKEKLEQELAPLTKDSELPLMQIEIIADAKTITKGSFKISYFVDNAGWYPKYDIRVKDVSSPIALRYKADVYQSTGEDWNSVKLRFSNANPNQSGLAPNLSTWRINYDRLTTYLSSSSDVINRSVRAVNGRVTDSETNEGLPGVNVIVQGTSVGTVTDINGYYSLTLPNNSEFLIFSFIGMTEQVKAISSSTINTRLVPDIQQLSEVVVTGYGVRSGSSRNSSYSPPPKVKQILTSTIENQTTVEFAIETPYTIESNNKTITVDLRSYQIDALYEYYGVPKLDKDAFLIARIVNWSKYNFLEGESNLFFEDAYVGRSILDAKSLSDTLDISLGRDRSIVLGREKVDDFSKRRTVGSNKIDSRKFNVIVRNSKSQPVKITIYDQLPVAAMSDIEVSATELSEGTLKELSGEITWTLNLSPNEQRILELGYEVKYPKREKIKLE